MSVETRGAVIRIRRTVACALLIGMAGASLAATQSQRRAPAVKGSPGTPAKEPPAASRCYPPQGESIPAQKVMRDLIEGKDVDLQGRIIEGSLDADAFWPSADGRRTTLRVIPGRLRLDSCRIVGRLAFPQVVLLQDLILTCTEVVGEVDLTETDLRGGFAAQHSRFLGEVRLNRLRAESDLDFKGAFFEDGLDVSEGGLHGLVLSDAEIRSDLEVRRSVVTGIELSGTKIGGFMKVEDALVLRSFLAAQAQIERGLTVASMRVTGPMDLSGSHGGAFSISDLSVAGPLMAALTNATPLTMTDVSAGQGLAMVDGHFGEMALRRVTVAGPTSFEGARFSGSVSMNECDFGRHFRATEALFERDVEFRRVRFPGEDPMLGALFTRAPLLIETALPKPPVVMQEDAPDDEALEEGDEIDEGEDGGEPDEESGANHR